MKHYLKTFIIICFCSPFLNAQSSVTLRHTFVDSLRNNVSITGTFIVDHVHDHPNSAAKDGDIHCAARSTQIGLPFVAEVMNAKYYKNVVTLLNSVEGSNTLINYKGAWRLWFEHPGEDQEQSDDVPKAKDTNPKHIFEIHPLLSVNGISLIKSLKPIEGYEPKEAVDAFADFLKAKCKITEENGYITIEAKQLGNNYVDMIIKITGSVGYSNDAAFVYCEVYNDSRSRTPVAKNIRMVFARDSEAEILLRSKKKNDRIGVLGIPRVNLNDVYNIAFKNKGKTVPSGLPFEMIIVGAN